MLLADRLQSYRLILASSSPRRRELLAATGLQFEIAPKFECEEIYPLSLPADEVAPYLSRIKSEAYPVPLLDSDILITADTTVVVEDMVFGKPIDEDDARSMLRSLSGREHSVITGVTLRTNRKTKTFSAKTRVSFREMTDEEINYYVAQFNPTDKAGAYGIQEWIGYVAIDRIEGSFYNVMGLPVQRLYVELDALLSGLDD